ncbi:MAG: BON domain-containing protein [Candidatus Promineifilaceae bacterium]
MNDYILNFGTAVHCYDEQCGKLAKAAINSKNWQVSDLVIEEGLLLKRSRVFPLSVVEWATEDEISISVDENNLSKYPEYQETVIEKIPQGASAEPAIVQGSPYGLATSSPVVPTVKELVIKGVDDNLDLIDTTTPVKTLEETVGTVYGLVVTPENGLITHILVHKGTIFVDAFLLSTAVVNRITTAGVFVNMTRDELDDLIENDERQDRHWNQMPTDTKIEKDLHDLRPYIDKEEFVMHDTIMNDETALAALVADALMNDPRTDDAVIEVIHERGIVTLRGTVEDIATKRAAEQIAAKYPGVVSVSNELAVDNR